MPLGSYLATFRVAFELDYDEITRQDRCKCTVTPTQKQSARKDTGQEGLQKSVPVCRRVLSALTL